MGKLTPKHCPKCGSTNVHNQELGSEHDYEEWYDVYCRDCEWSGYISPDLPLSSKQGKRAGSRKRQNPTVEGEVATEEVRDYDVFIREEKLHPQETQELKALKREALRGECVPLEEVLKKHRSRDSGMRTAPRAKPPTTAKS